MNIRNRVNHTLLTIIVCILIASSSIHPAFALADRPTSYELQKGEFPFCIARRFNLDPFQLLRINGLRSGQIYYPGLVLSMPSSMGVFPGNRALRAHAPYTVRAGDTIGTVACYFGDVGPAAILSLNELSDPNNLPAGKVLKIPEGSFGNSSTVPTAAVTNLVENALPTATNTPVPTATAPAVAPTSTVQAMAITPEALSAAPTNTATPPTAVPATNTAVPPTSTTVLPAIEPTITLVPPTAVLLTGTPEPQVPTSTISQPTATPVPQARQLNIFEKFWLIAQEMWQVVFKPTKPTQVAVVQPAATERPSEIPFPSITPLPTETPMPTWTPTATGIPVLQLDLNSMNTDLPSDVEDELNFQGGGGGGTVCEQLDNPELVNHQLPFPNALLEMVGDNENYLENEPFRKITVDSNIFVNTCGWDADDLLTAELRYPSGKVETVTSKTIQEGWRPYIYNGYFKFYIGLYEPLGEYILSIKATSGRNIVKRFNVEKPDSPRIRYSHNGPNMDHYHLYGFKPGESIRLLYYFGDFNTLKLSRWYRSQANEKGELSVDLPVDQHLILDPISYHSFPEFNENLEKDFYLLFAVGEISGGTKPLPGVPYMQLWQDNGLLK